ncbi:MAG: AEC family transporter [Gemmatimonadaceae bacterium]|nr:AEC family transporter [Acetobacteraceae bacterium]
MGAVAGIVAPIFALILMGAGARRFRLLDPAGLRGLHDLTFYLGIPALLFGAVVGTPALRILDVGLLYFAGCVLVFVAGVALARRTLGAGLAQASVLGLNCCYGNTVMMGVPMVAAAFGPDGVAILLPVIALHSILLLPMATMLIEADGHATRNPLRILWRTGPSLIRNPVIVAITLALLWRGVGIPVPDPLHRLLAMLGAAAPTLALFSLGASLPDFAAQGSLREAVLATVLKLLALPALVWAGAWAAGTPPLATAVLVLTAGAPTGANAFFLARRTGTLAAASAGAVVLSTALSVMTLSAILALVRP